MAVMVVQVKKEEKDDDDASPPRRGIRNKPDQLMAESATESEILSTSATTSYHHHCHSSRSSKEKGPVSVTMGDRCKAGFQTKDVLLAKNAHNRAGERPTLQSVSLSFRYYVIY
jgi:hypothetical protein